MRSTCCMSALMRRAPGVAQGAPEERRRGDHLQRAHERPGLRGNVLRNLRAVLIHLLEIVEQDSAIDAAVDSLADAASADLKEVELAAGMQTKAGDRAVARRLNDLELAFAALRRSLAPAKPRPALLW